jgi:hypothetical protein
VLVITRLRRERPARNVKSKKKGGEGASIIRHPPPPNYLARNVSVHANSNRLTVKDDIRKGLVAASCSDNGSLSRLGRTGRHGQGNSNLASVFIKLNFHGFLSSLGVNALLVLVVVVPLLSAALLGPIVKLRIGQARSI